MTINPYETCPVFENNNYLLRLISIDDAEDLLRVYSDEKAVPFFNSDNCHGDDFHYTSPERMRSAIEYWQMEYNRGGFVRWAIVDKNICKAIGTIELFNRHSNDYFNNCGLLRLDLRSDYEKSEIIQEILLLILKPSFELFDCEMIATKVHPDASERLEAVKKLNFIYSNEKLTGGNGRKAYIDYYVTMKS